MSSAKGNIKRNRPQKYQNRTVFKNDLHDTSKKTKVINSLQIAGVCERCKEIIEWKIKYKKYKALTMPKKCVGCEQKTIKHAYHIYCDKCRVEKNVCAKCCKSLEVSESSNKDDTHNITDTEVLDIMKRLSERKRRTLARYIKKADGNTEEIAKIISEMSKFELNDDSCDSSCSEDLSCDED
ncbi:unnamed protein product [Leptidea sinapis]|uniref:Uncharacterized protein n=1 Tax=Leptidea sinapis TaxID=189913 RepID=A0A5E4QAW0_9NEOP|nr:unnamed protein product [Leptidea sinapis]